MNGWLRIVVLGAISILAFNVVASVSSKFTGIPYTYAVIGSALIYFAVGFFAVRASESVGMAALAAGLVGLVEATLGWRLSKLIGPVVPAEPVADDPIRTFAVVATVVMVSAIAVAIGAVGGMVGKRQLA
jgi:hypothetical protein